MPIVTLLSVIVHYDLGSTGLLIFIDGTEGHVDKMLLCLNICDKVSKVLLYVVPLPLETVLIYMQTM